MHAHVAMDLSSVLSGETSPCKDPDEFDKTLGKLMKQHMPGFSKDQFLETDTEVIAKRFKGNGKRG